MFGSNGPRLRAIENRMLVRVEPKQPFVDWINSIPDPPPYDRPLTLDEVGDFCFLMEQPSHQNDQIVDHVRTIYGPFIMADMFQGYYPDPALLPKSPEELYAEFDHWFAIELDLDLYDTGDGRLDLGDDIVMGLMR